MALGCQATGHYLNQFLPSHIYIYMLVCHNEVMPNQFESISLYFHESHHLEYIWYLILYLWIPYIDLFDVMPKNCYPGNHLCAGPKADLISEITSPAFIFLYVWSTPALDWEVTEAWGGRNTIHPWTSYKIRKLRVAHAPGMPGTFSPPPTLMETAS